MVCRCKINLLNQHECLPCGHITCVDAYQCFNTSNHSSFLLLMAYKLMMYPKSALRIAQHDGNSHKNQSIETRLDLYMLFNSYTKNTSILNPFMSVKKLFWETNGYFAFAYVIYMFHLNHDRILKQVPDKSSQFWVVWGWLKLLCCKVGNKLRLS